MLNMDRQTFGLIILSSDRKIIFASAAAQSLLQKKTCIYSEDGYLVFIRPDDNDEFFLLLQDGSSRAQLDDHLQIQCPKSGQRFLLLAVPASEGEVNWSPNARWLIFIVSTEPEYSFPEKILQQKFKLTPAECALTRRMIHGDSITKAAAKIGISPHTARTQLKSIYIKTGVNSQAKLICLILNATRNYFTVNKTL